MGLSEKLFSEAENLFEAAFEHVKKCPCESGCPVCVGPPLEVGPEGKEGALLLLEFMLEVELV